LNALFSQVGTVESCRIITDRDTGRSRGFGFVEMSSKAEGEAAIARFSGMEIDGRALTVNEAKPQEQRGGGGGFRGGGGGGRGGDRGRGGSGNRW
jgi:RNA recognition motif-containing protein